MIRGALAATLASLAACAATPAPTQPTYEDSLYAATLADFGEVPIPLDLRHLGSVHLDTTPPDRLRVVFSDSPTPNLLLDLGPAKGFRTTGEGDVLRLRTSLNPRTLSRTSAYSYDHVVREYGARLPAGTSFPIIRDAVSAVAAASPQPAPSCFGKPVLWIEVRRNGVVSRYRTNACDPSFAATLAVVEPALDLASATLSGLTATLNAFEDGGAAAPLFPWDATPTQAAYRAALEPFGRGALADEAARPGVAQRIPFIETYRLLVVRDRSAVLIEARRDLRGEPDGRSSISVSRVGPSGGPPLTTTAPVTDLAAERFARAVPWTCSASAERPHVVFAELDGTVAPAVADVSACLSGEQVSAIIAMAERLIGQP